MSLDTDTVQETSENTQAVVSPAFDSQIDAAQVPFRLGLFGGTFDPVHVGHLHIAERAYEQFKLNGVLFIPAGIPAHKDQTEISGASHRYAMLLKAIKGNGHFDVSQIEIQRSGITYTIDTLHIIKERFQNHAELFFIVGADTAVEIGTWKDANEVTKLVTVLSARRTITPAQGQGSAPLQASCALDLCPIDSALVDISSRELRESVKAGKSIRYLVPDEVCTYIQEQGLYRG